MITPFMPLRTVLLSTTATQYRARFINALAATLLLVANAVAQDHVAAPTPVLSTDTASPSALDSIKFTASFGVPIALETLDLSDISTSVGSVQNLSQQYGAVSDTANNRLSQQQGVAVDASGTTYTAHTKRHLIQLTNNSGVPGLIIGTGGAGAGNDQFAYPHDVAVDSQGHIYVADTSNHRIQIFDHAGTYQRTIGAGVAGTTNNHFNAPYGVAVDALDSLYVADTSNHRIQIFDHAGEYQQTIGTGIAGDSNQQFKFPQDLEIDAGGSIYVMDTGNRRVQILERVFTFEFEVAGLSVGDTLLVHMPAGAVQNVAGDTKSTASNTVEIHIAAELKVLSAATNQTGDALVLGMSEAVVNSGAVTEGFTVRSAANLMVTHVEVSAADSSMVMLALSAPVTTGETVMLDYAQTGGSIGTTHTPSMPLSDFTDLAVVNNAGAAEHAKQLNKSIVPRLTQTIIASTMNAIEYRMDAAFSGATQVADYTLGVPELRNIQASANAVATKKGGQLLANMLMQASTNAVATKKGGQWFTSLLDHEMANDHDQLGHGLLNDIQSVAHGAIDWRRAVLDSSFVLPLQVAGTNSGNASGVVLWGGGDYSGLNGDSSGVDWDGNVQNYQLGVETRLHSGTLLGGLFSWGKGDFGYSQYVSGVSPATETGTYTMKLNSIHPYIGSMLSGDTSMWGSLGYGHGSLEIDVDGGVAPRTSDVGLLSLAVGIKKQLSDGGDSKVAVKGDVALAQTSIEGNASHDIDEQTISSQRLRLLLNGSHDTHMDSDRLLTPSVEAGLRFDGGEGIDSVGLDLAAGLRYASVTPGFTIEGKAHVFDSDDYDEWGVSGLVSLAPDGGQGLAFRLHPGYGNTVSDAERVWKYGVFGDTNNRDQDNTAWMDMHIGYGISASDLGGQGLLTLYSEATLGEGTNRYRLGGHLPLTQLLELTLEAERRELSTAPATHDILLRGKLRL